MRTLSKKQKAVIAGVAVATLGTSGVAYAYWSAGGTGDGTGTAGATTNFTITNPLTAGSPLSPNGPTQTATFNVHNPGSGVQRMTQVVVTVANTDGSAWTPVGCSAADFALGGGAAGAAYTIAHVESINPATDSAQLSVSLQMVDTGANQNGCQNVTVPLHYVVS